MLLRVEPMGRSITMESTVSVFKFSWAIAVPGLSKLRRSQLPQAITTRMRLGLRGKSIHRLIVGFCRGLGFWTPRGVMAQRFSVARKGGDRTPRRAGKRRAKKQRFSQNSVNPQRLSRQLLARLILLKYHGCACE
jgi:hypothetical protein